MILRFVSIKVDDQFNKVVDLCQIIFTYVTSKYKKFLIDLHLSNQSTLNELSIRKHICEK